MKRKLLIGSIAATIIFGGAIAAGAAKNNRTTDELQENGQAMITLEEAKQIALTQQDGSVKDIELESSSRNHYYEVEVDNGNKDYKFHIDAYSGEILSTKEQRDNDRDDFDNDNDDWSSQSPTDKNLLSPEEAIAIAEKEVSGKMVEVDRDNEDGRLIYEIELLSNNKKVELELDAVTGDILKMEHDD